MEINRIQKAFQHSDGGLLNIFFTAGFPTPEDIESIITKLNDSGVNMIELGIPYSDPLADGLTIQKSSKIALENGMNLNIAFDAVQKIRTKVDLPIIMMGYYNQFLQYGFDKLMSKMKAHDVDGLIIPDMPLDYYEKFYKGKFEKANIAISFLITPETSEERIRYADKLTTGFIYVVAQSSLTGNANDISQDQKKYFERIKNMNLSNPKLIGFGIHDKTTFNNACQFAEGAIIGSAFIRCLEKYGTDGIESFIENIL